MPGNASTFFGLGGGGKPLSLVGRRIFKTSGNIVIPAGCKYDIFAVGASGSGGSVVSGDGRATGGGGAGWSRDWGEVATDTAVTVTLGAPGAGTTAASGAQNGNDGGTTTVVGTGINISITGGKKGLASATATAANGGDGGVASGGKFNVNGSRGGNIATTATGPKATGGGSVNLFATATANATRGGDIANSIVGSGQATGGGGVGGRGGDNPTGNSTTAGGGAGGDAGDGATSPVGADITGGTATNTQPATNFVLDVLGTFPGIMPTSSGNAGASATLEGGGTAGGTGASSGVPALGGGGAIAHQSGNAAGANVTRGGGSGGVAALGGSLANSGTAGAAYVVVSIYKEQS